MRKSRVVEVWAGLTDGSWSCGSGYLITEHLVLTAAHVIVEERCKEFHAVASSPDILLRAHGKQDPLRGTVVWRGANSELDIALVEIDDAAWQPPVTLSPIRWGTITCEMPRIECSAMGFPRALLLPDEVREREQLDGRINPGAGEKSCQYHIAVDNAPTRHMAGGSPWSGMSGAAVFSADLLIGVVVIDLDGFDGHRLTAVRIEAALRDPGFRGLIPKAVLESAELCPLFATMHRHRQPRSPAELLTPRTAAVGWYSGRDDHLNELLNWLATDEPLDIRLVVGAGGHGKTRLAHELAQRANEDGWFTGLVQAETADQLPRLPMERLSSCEVPLLLIVDYAETRPDVVRRLLEELPVDGGARIRLLLLARSPGQWWERLWRSSEVLHVRMRLDDVTVLGPLDIAQRAEIFSKAVAELAESLPKVLGLAAFEWGPQEWADAASRVAVPDLHPDRLDSIMRVQLAALVGLLQQGPAPVENPAGAISPEDIDILIAHEQKYWDATAATRKLALTSAALANAVTVATLVGAADRDHAIAVLARVRGLGDETENTLMDVDEWLQELYPSADVGRWGAFEPDRLGEHLVGKQLEEWPTLLDAPLAAATDVQWHRALHVLARASADYKPVRKLILNQVSGQIRRIGPIALKVVVETEDPTSLLDALKEGITQASDDLEILAELAEHFPASTPALAQLAEQLIGMEISILSRLCQKSEEYLGRLAKATERHADILDDLGRPEDALTLRSKAVDLYRQLRVRPMGGEEQT